MCNLSYTVSKLCTCVFVNDHVKNNTIGIFLFRKTRVSESDLGYLRAQDTTSEFDFRKIAKTADSNSNLITDSDKPQEPSNHRIIIMRMLSPKIRPQEVSSAFSVRCSAGSSKNVYRFSPVPTKNTLDPSKLQFCIISIMVSEPANCSKMFKYDGHKPCLSCFCRLCIQHSLCEAGSRSLNSGAPSNPSDGVVSFDINLATFHHLCLRTCP